MNKVVLSVLIGGLVAAPASAATQHPAASDSSQGQHGESLSSYQRKDAKGEAREAMNVIRQMKKDPELVKTLEHAKGVFLVPDYDRFGLVVGGAGGHGVLLAKRDGTWRGPVFYNVGSVSLGLQVGGVSGQLAMILVSDKAVNSFMGNNNFSINANSNFSINATSGLSIINWSRRAQASFGESDILLWLDTEGAYAGVSLSATDINADEHANHAFYNTGQANPGAILEGRFTASESIARQLRDALAA